MNYPERLVPWTGLAVIAACALSTPPVGAVPVTYTDQTAWQNAILALNPTATTKLETFDGTDTVIPPGLGSGPHSFGGGDFTITLNNVGNGGSQAGIVNNQFQMRLAVDTADIDLGGFIIKGEGAQSIDFAFTTPGVFAFGGSWSNGTQTNGVKSDDGINISVNGVSLLLDPTGGAGFFGVVDAAGLSSFRLLPDGLSTTTFFQDADLNDFRYALPGAPPPTTAPEPGTLVLFGIGAAGMGFAGRRRRFGS